MLAKGKNVSIILEQILLCNHGAEKKEKSSDTSRGGSHFKSSGKALNQWHLESLWPGCDELPSWRRPFVTALSVWPVLRRLNYPPSNRIGNEWKSNWIGTHDHTGTKSTFSECRLFKKTHLGLLILQSHNRLIWSSLSWPKVSDFSPWNNPGK